MTQPSLAAATTGGQGQVLTSNGIKSSMYWTAPSFNTTTKPNIQIGNANLTEDTLQDLLILLEMVKQSETLSQEFNCIKAEKILKGEL